MQKNTLIKVLNRYNGSSVYSIPEMNGLRRVFQSGEVKQVTFEELQKLSYIPGGKELLEENLVILDNPQAIKLLLGHTQPEYSYNRDDIIKIMRDGSLDEFLDCLDFAPEGVKDMIKHLAVELPLNDVAKREAIYNKMGFNVNNAIERKRIVEEEVPHKQAPTRRVAKEGSESNSTVSRRVVKKVNN